MSVLPAQPNLDHLRRQARDLLRAARAGESPAVDRVQAVSDRLTLAAAQLAVAREYGFASWAKLKTEVQARGAELAKLADEFCVASIRDWTGRATRMLEARPELASYNLATAVVLGDVDRVRAAVEADPSLATRTDPTTGWTALHAACGSQWNRLDPSREQGLVAVAKLLLDAGADPNGVVSGGGWKPLRCAVAGAPNAEIARLLLDRGAVPDDDDLYLAGFGDDNDTLRLLLSGPSEIREIAKMALAAPLSGNNVEGVRLLLDAGADPRLYLDDADAEGGSDTAHPFSVLYAAVRSDCTAEIVELLLIHGAEPEAPGPDGRSPHALAVSKGRTDLAELLRRYGASDDASDVDRFLAACLRGDREAAEHQLPSDLSAPQRSAAMVRAAETGNIEAMRIMLDLGFPPDTRGGDDPGTPLHTAAHAGSADIARLLLERGADVNARDERWDSTPMVWAMIGSSERPTGNPSPDWPATVEIMANAGASFDGITLSPDDDHPPSPAVVELLRRYGVEGEQR
ncbi:MAG TPA: ankyrin repeat domain-containing protein [Streptosporangiaceae bacterium]|nr:ankyrin repeat domain-containing protein [Streptosporangiaceae bacterium]